MKKRKADKSKIILIIQAVMMYLIHVPLYVAIILDGLKIDVVDAMVDVLLYIACVPLILMVPVCIVSLVFACLHFKRTEESPVKTTMIVKLCLIPWYILNFVTCWLMITGFLDPDLFIVMPLLATCTLMLTTSFHSMAYTVRYLVVNKIKLNELMLTALIFHVIFCLDIAGAVMLQVGFKKLEAEQKQLEEVNDSAQDAVIQDNLLKISNERNIKKKSKANKSKIILIIQTVMMYLIQVPLGIIEILYEVKGNAFDSIGVCIDISCVPIALMIPVLFISLIFACLHFVRDKESPLKTAMIVKLCLIPWYILNLYFCFTAVAGFLNPFLLVAVPLLIVLEVVATYIYMFATSLHSITYTVRYLISHKIKPKKLIITALVFHVIFCLDTIGAIMLYIGHKKLEAEQKQFEEVNDGTQDMQ